MPPQNEFEAKRLAAALRRMGLLAPGETPGLRRVAPASTHVVHAATTRAGRFALRVSADPAAESEAAALAHRLGLCAEPAGIDGESGTIATRWIARGRPLTSARLRRDAAARDAAAALLARLHGSGARLTRVRDPVGFIAIYQAQLGSGAALWLDAADAAVAAAQAAWAAGPALLAPCHGDPAPANLLDDGRRLWLIDWEYAAMADPAWDLGYLAAEAGLGAGAAEALVRSHGDPRLTASRVRIAMLLAAATSLLWEMSRVKADASLARAEARRRRALESLAGDPLILDALRAARG